MRQAEYKQYSYLYKFFSAGQRYKITVLVFFILVFPFLKIFTDIYFILPMANPAIIWSVFNFLAITGFAIAFLLHKKMYSWKVFLFTISVFVLLILNYLLSEMASLKWMINWAGFLFIALMVMQLFKSLSDAEMYIFQVRAISVMKVLISLLTVLLLFALVIEPWYLNPAIFKYYVFEDLNQIHGLHRRWVGVNKQHIGILYLLIIAFSITHWHLLSDKFRALILFFFFFNLPAMFGVRTLILGLLSGSMVLFFLKYNYRKFIALMLFLVVVLVIYQYRAEIMLVVVELYDRLPSLTFAWSAMTENLFGLGNGAYHLYVLEHNDMLVEQFGSERMTDKGLFWAAPESDLVYFIASWGILSVFFFGFLGYVVAKCTHYFHHSKVSFPIERAFFFLTVCFILMGISQDNAGNLTWWLFMATSLGLIFRKQQKIIEPDGATVTDAVNSYGYLKKSYNVS